LNNGKRFFIITTALLLLASCFPLAPEPTIERPIMPDTADIIIPLAPLEPYMPKTQSETYGWPSRPLTIVVPFLPGGDTNMYARMFAPFLAEILGQPVYVMNIDGASGTAGAESVSRTAPDGYTMLFYHTGNLFTNILTGETDLNYHDFDIACIAMHCNANVLVIRSDLGIYNAADFLSYAADNPGRLDVATTITGFSFKLLRMAEIAGGFETNPIHVGGGSMMAPSILAGHTQVGYNNIALFLPYIESGEMIPLWLAAGERNIHLPNVPAIREVGIEGGYMGRSYFFAFPRGTDEAILQKMSGTVQQITNNPDFIQQIFDTVGLPTYFVSYFDATAYLSEMWSRVMGLEAYMQR